MLACGQNSEKMQHTSVFTSQNKTVSIYSSCKLFFNAYILPHIDYCCTIWGNGNSDSLNSVIKFQKRAARLILDKDFNISSDELFAELNWMTFPERVNFQKAVMMFKTMIT